MFSTGNQGSCTEVIPLLQCANKASNKAVRNYKEFIEQFMHLVGALNLIIAVFWHISNCWKRAPTLAIPQHGFLVRTSCC